MTTITTRRAGVPIVATLKAHPSTGHPVWEVRIAPEVDMDHVPFDLRSTYVCVELTTPLNIAIAQVEEWSQRADWVDLCLFWYDIEQAHETRADLIGLSDHTGELWLGQPLPEDALYPEMEDRS